MSEEIDPLNIPTLLGLWGGGYTVVGMLHILYSSVSPLDYLLFNKRVGDSLIPVVLLCKKQLVKISDHCYLMIDTFMTFYFNFTVRLTFSWCDSISGMFFLLLFSRGKNGAVYFRFSSKERAKYQFTDRNTPLEILYCDYGKRNHQLLFDNRIQAVTMDHLESRQNQVNLEGGVIALIEDFSALQAPATKRTVLNQVGCCAFVGTFCAGFVNTTSCN